MINILGFSGSLRKGSYNRLLLKNCLELLPPGAALDIFDLEGFPAFNQDFENAPPPIVAAFKQKIRAADAILIVTPEANYSVPGVLKNAMDWASRPYGDNSFKGKDVAIMSASIGMLGGARAQYHLRQSFVFLEMHAVNMPEVFLGLAAEKFDPSGALKDDKARELMRALLKTLVEQARKSLGKN